MNKILEEATRPPGAGIRGLFDKQNAQEATQPKRQTQEWKRRYRTLRKKGQLR